ncbi:myoneurin-like [Microplitis mediator]|uniref:myoneurin-like n=1 Tax=Microplitis mediator TaxID=375433 RepID=UPI0025532ECB|nr:myoneurin-like [Microplitis mediator]
MSYNNSLSKILNFLSIAVKDIEIPENSVITCSISEGLLGSQPEVTQSAENICGNENSKFSDEMSYKVESVEYICQDCERSFSSAKLHREHVQDFHNNKAENFEKVIKTRNDELLLFQPELKTDTVEAQHENGDRNLFLPETSKLEDTNASENHCEDDKRLWNQPGNDKVQGADTRGKKLYECNDCQNKYWKRKSLVTHIHRSHRFSEPENSKSTISSLSEKKYECDICHLKFLKQHSLLRHTRNEHSQSLPEVNPPENIKLELMSTTEGPHECDICFSRFCSSYSVRRHKFKIHSIILDDNDKSKFCTTSEKKFKCKICRSQFTTIWNLKRHKLTVHLISEDKNNESKFASMSGKKYECYICQAQYSHHRTLLHHMRKKHSISQPKSTELKFSTVND